MSYLHGAHILKLILILLKIFNALSLHFYLCNFPPNNYDNRLKRLGLQCLELRCILFTTYVFYLCKKEIPLVQNDSSLQFFFQDR